MRQKLHKQPSSKTKKSRKKLLIIAALVFTVLIGSGLFGYLRYKHNKDNVIRPENTVDYSKSSKSDNTSSENRKSNNSTATSSSDSNGAASNSKDSNSTATSSGTSDSSSTPANFSVTVTGVNQNGSNEIVSTLVNGVTSGTCTVKFTKSGQPDVTATNQLTQNTNTYACPNFTISYDQFPVGGEWSASVSVTNNGKTVTGTWANNPVTIKK